MAQECVSRWVQGRIHAPQAAVARVYRPRQPRATALYQCVARHAPEWRAACDAMRAAGFQPVTSCNPYWDARGRTFEDPDGYRVVPQQEAWSGAGGP